MIDIHVLTHSGTRQDWLDQCLASLASEPCTVHVVEGFTGHIGRGRALGYTLGAHPYVGFVDPDDYVLPGVMSACLAGLEKHSAVVTKERVLYADGSMHPHPKRGHHIAVYRREVVTPVLPFLERVDYFGDKLMREHINPEPLDFVGYVWRAHDQGVHRRFVRADYEARKTEWLLS